MEIVEVQEKRLPGSCRIKPSNRSIKVADGMQLNSSLHFTSALLQIKSFIFKKFNQPIGQDFLHWLFILNNSQNKYTVCRQRRIYVGVSGNYFNFSWCWLRSFLILFYFMKWQGLVCLSGNQSSRILARNNFTLFENTGFICIAT